MSKKKQGDKTRAIKNSIFSIRLMWGINKGNIFTGILSNLLGYFGWVFYSVFFIRYLVGAIERKEDFKKILTFILV